jgi:hypothetical protein
MAAAQNGSPEAAKKRPAKNPPTATKEASPRHSTAPSPVAIVKLKKMTAKAMPAPMTPVQ